ncbi:sulfotransferase domain-containing protein [Nocardioides sp.]|uniref:sulfotransferase domain-containing protein n=1 Tax=Nocardioides sp. TaxID=35761 RepID=UPI00345CBA02
MSSHVHGFIIGAQKAGSTSLDRYIACHPDVLAARHEVPALEDPDYGRGGVERVDQWIRSRERPGLKVVLRRPNYLCRTEVPARMASEWPEVRLVAVLRDPVARAKSAYFHYMRYGLLPVAPVDEGLERLLSGDLSPRWPRSTEVLGFGEYGSAMRRWREHFESASILVLDSTDLRVRPAEVLARVARHLQIRDDVPLPELADGMPGSYDMKHVRARAAAFPLLYSATDGGRLEARWKLPQIYDRLERTLWPDKSSPPELSAALDTQLRAHYAEDVQDLLSFLAPTQVPSWAHGYT